MKSGRHDMQLRNFGHGLRGWLGYHGLFGKLNPPTMVIGCQNSGTTILANTLALHPEITNHSEARVLWDPRFHERNTETLKTALDVTASDVYRLRGNFAYYQWKSGSKLVINKHPENSLRVHFIKKIFPEARIIHLVRDGRATVCSNLKRLDPERGLVDLPFAGYSRPPGWREWMNRPHIEQFSYMWNTLALYASREGKQYGDDYLELRYEDLVNDGPRVIRNVWCWLGLEKGQPDDGHFPVFRDENNKWKERLKRDQIQIIHDIAAEGLSYFGYR
jgi:omega-hydroxy-beta-dihydromenaquinone-9 sulfotransferase